MADEAVTREELERALRFLNSTMTQMRDELLQLGAQVVTLTSELEARGAVSQQAVMAALPAAVDQVRCNDEASLPLRVELGEEVGDRDAVESPPIPCGELLPLCKARCCTLTFRLSPQDLDDGVVRWDYGRPYRNLRRADGYCVHNQTGSFGCEVYRLRPAPCRAFDCRTDDRIWIDFDKRIPAPEGTGDVHMLRPPSSPEELAERARLRRRALDLEESAVRTRRR